MCYVPVKDHKDPIEGVMVPKELNVNSHESLLKLG
jgi:hypothetical protein